jgi:hypothetical protein
MNIIGLAWAGRGRGLSDALQADMVPIRCAALLVVPPVYFGGLALRSGGADDLGRSSSRRINPKRGSGGEPDREGSRRDGAGDRRLTND